MTEQDKLEIIELWNEVTKQERSTYSNGLGWVRDSLIGLRTDLTEIKTSLNDFKQNTCEHFTRLNGQTARNTAGIQNYKVWRGFITGGLTVISACLIPLIINFFTK